MTDFRRRAYAGVLIVFSWNYVNLLVAFAGNLVLARLLTPHDFGLVAVGATVSLVVNALTEGGLGSRFIQRSTPPSEAELRTLAGVQFTVTLLSTVVIILVALPWGTAGQVTALMVVALPISALQTAGRVVLIRDVRMSSLTAVDAAGLIAQYVWSIATVLLGMGVWGFASGTIARAVSQVIVLSAIPGGGLRRPTFERLREFGSIVTFGIRYQAVWIVVVLREQAANAVIGFVGNLSTLGLWSLGSRLMQVPYAPFESLIRVTFPTMSAFLAEGEDTKPVVERFARVSAVGTALVLSAFAGSAPGLVPGLFGEAWSDLVPVFPGTCLGLMIAASVRTATSGFLFASNRPGPVLNSSILYGVALLVTIAVLLPQIGIAAIGLGWVAGALVEAFVVTRATRRVNGARVGVQLVRPIVAAALGATAGWLVASSAERPLLGGVAGGIVAGVVTLAALFIISRASLVDFFQAGRQSVRHALGREGVEGEPLPEALVDE